MPAKRQVPPDYQSRCYTTSLTAHFAEDDSFLNIDACVCI